MIGWKNGKTQPVEEMQLPVLDRGVQYGEGLYETMLVDREHVPFLNRHQDRLHGSCKRLELPYPGDERVSRAIQETIDANALQQTDRARNTFVLKLLLTGGTGESLYRKPTPEPNLLLLPRPFPDQVDTWKDRGGICRLVPARGNTGADLGQVKSTSRLDEALALERVHQSDDEYREALFVDEDHRMLQGAKSNIFVQLEHTWYTPPVSEGLLPGIARDVLLDGSDSGSVTKRTLFTRDVLQAESVVVTNAVTGPIPIREIVAPSLLADDRGPLTFSVPDATVLDEIWADAL